MSNMKALAERQGERNDALLENTQFLGDEIASDVLGLHIDIAATETLGEAEDRALTALQIESACTAIRALASLAEIGELDHLGGGLELIPGLLMTLSLWRITIRVLIRLSTRIRVSGIIRRWRRLGLWRQRALSSGFGAGWIFPGMWRGCRGGTQLNGGRLGVMIPVAVGLALGKKALCDDAWVIAHCGDAGWISGQGLNGFNWRECTRCADYLCDAPQWHSVVG